MAKASDKALSEGERIERLLILHLVSSGVTQAQIAAALEIDAGTLSKMFEKGLLRSVRQKS